MKLVDILARELEVWPEGADSLAQSFGGMIFYINSVVQLKTLFRTEVSDDWREAMVFKPQWQAAVDALKAENCAHLWVGWSDTEACELCNKNRKIIVEWNGDGLPPVGIDVEVFADYSHPRFDRLIGQQVHIVAHDAINGDPVAVFRMPVDGDDTEQDYHAMVAGSFRPLRTPEQIAADERKRVTDEIQSICGDAENRGTPYFEALYDAGYRKFEIVDN